MYFRPISFIACVGSVFLHLSGQAVYSQIAPSTQKLRADLSAKARTALSLEQISDRAQAITVKILAGHSWGSGILIQRKGQVYTVVTNAHVLRIGDTYKIQTSDGKIYSATTNTTTQFNDYDLGLLNFRSTNYYQIATLGNSSAVGIGDEMFASGFPAEGNDNQQRGFLLRRGQVSFLLPKSFVGGYQLGYSNDIEKGMSGGPVLNSYGEVVAINGRHKNALWGNIYIFNDGSTPVQMPEELDNSSWAVPINTFLHIAPQFLQGSVAQDKIIDAVTPVSAIPAAMVMKPIKPMTVREQTKVREQVFSIPINIPTEPKISRKSIENLTKQNPHPGLFW